MRSATDRETFLALPTEAIADLVRDMGKPQVGIFVPDGNRRLVLAETELQEGSDEFFMQVAHAQTTLGLNTLQVFFSHGLPILFTPLFSSSVLARGEDYCRLTALKTLGIMLTDDEWLDFYEAFDIRVRVYGDMSALAQPGCENALQWIKHAPQITQNHTTHTLFVGIGNEPMVGHDAAQAVGRFYQTYQRKPTSDELVEFLYGQAIPPADFFIMSSKLAGLGALPALVCGKDTQVYYLAVPGVMGLTERTYRAILHDLLYMRDERGRLDFDNRKQLHAWYSHHAETIIGLEHKIGSAWVPDSWETHSLDQ
ncbi:MAG: hypothetical protein JW850_00240 [Thermoflexales bacterium]|nr:hypothetical protein [Thermoflexales bacterium]